MDLRSSKMVSARAQDLQTSRSERMAKINAMTRSSQNPRGLAHDREMSRQFVASQRRYASQTAEQPRQNRPQIQSGTKSMARTREQVRPDLRPTEDRRPADRTEFQSRKSVYQRGNPVENKRTVNRNPQARRSAQQTRIPQNTDEEKMKNFQASLARYKQGQTQVQQPRAVQQRQVQQSRRPVQQAQVQQPRRAVQQARPAPIGRPEVKAARNVQPGARSQFQSSRLAQTRGIVSSPTEDIRRRRKLEEHLRSLSK